MTSGRKGLAGLPKPPRRYRVDKAPQHRGKSFERRIDAPREDRLRARRAITATSKNPSGLLTGLDAEIAKLIADLQRSPRDKRLNPTLTSKVSMRQMRIIVIGWLWKMILSSVWGTATTIHITPRDWVLTGNQLLRSNPRTLLKKLRVALYRDGAATADGYLIVFLDAEFDPRRDVFHLHVHGIAAGGMIAVVDRLRKRKNFRRIGKAHPPIKIVRQRLRFLPWPLTYLWKSDWFAVWRWTDVNGVRRKSRKQRIREPYGTIFRVWLSRWTADDVCLRIRLTVGKRGFQVTQQKTYKKGGRS